MTTLKPDGRLHADGYFTWNNGKRPGYLSDQRLPCDFYLAPVEGEPCPNADQCNVEGECVEGCALRGWHTPARQAMPDDFLGSVKRLCMAARTTGGTAGRDAGLCAALDRVEQMLQAIDDPAWQAQATQRSAADEALQRVCCAGYTQGWADAHAGNQHSPGSAHMARIIAAIPAARNSIPDGDVCTCNSASGPDYCARHAS